MIAVLLHPEFNKEYFIVIFLKKKMEKKISGKHGNRVAVMKERMATVVLVSALLLGGGLTAKAQNTAVTTCSQSAATAIQQNPNWKANAAEWQKLKGEITLYMTNDMGRNGYYDQKPIAELMGRWPTW